MKTIAIASQKGGTGKTTTAVHLATAATLAGFDAVVIDLDPQLGRRSRRRRPGGRQRTGQSAAGADRWREATGL
jgi:cellulose biosynthesis protein BcsQ